jgi:hypothetical protein
MNEGEQKTYDLVVIGTGTAASTTASECSSALQNDPILYSYPTNCSDILYMI